ncbi:ATP-binding protein [uncultured Tyzzerella sp.]|uniref:Lon protease family protein n=1 Tax=uncultured Tyzzerella sp. TaxID=2321398 RepID=UPI002942A813|nr:ATP-binding protein [uncultured Tyzzerella sp.]
MVKELKYKELKGICDIKLIEKLENIQADDNIIGQNKAIEALEFGLNIKNKGYNIYVSGPVGSGKTTFSKKYAKKYAINEKTPDDLVYVYNFENPKCPRALFLEAGLGKEFKQEIDDLIYTLSVEIPKAFSSKEHEEEKNKIVKEYNIKRDEIIKQITELAKEKDFGIKNSNTGIYFMPIIDGETISEEEYEDLSEEEKEIISKKSEQLQEDATKTMKLIRNMEKDTKKDIENIEYNLGLFTVGHYINAIQSKYKDNKKVTEYLKELKEDIIENIDNFLEEEIEEEEGMPILPLLNKKNDEELFAKYKVNVIVDNSKLNGAPVVLNYNPSYTNLVGEVEFENELGNFTTDYMKIKGGIFHKANGGYLILHIDDILKSAYSLETIIRTLKTGEVCIEPLKEYQLGGIAITTIKPEPIKVNLKIILIGSSYYYDILSEYEEDFLKFFKIHSIFDYEMDNNEENISDIIKFIRNFEKKENSLKFDKTAIKVLVEHIIRLAGKKDKLSTKFNAITEILIEANTWAKIDGASIVCEKYIKKAIDKKIDFINLYEKKYEDMILEGDIMIKTDGAEIGQINGLAVLDYGSYSFGKPTKITATTYVGKSGIVNIEKEAEMSGSIHNKGVQVITGYLGRTYANLFPLSLSCRICFEQNYNGVDGDSASSTELYAIISSLSDTPIKQGIAVTGSVNQMGEIQPIGGVNEKIEGFFDICNKRGLTGTQGVLIPVQNVKDLCLKDDVIEAVKNGKFHIYPISNIDEGIYILMGEKAGKKNKNNTFTKDSIHFKAMKKLQYFYKKGNEE